MAYFPNGSSAAKFDNECSECVVCDDDGKHLCPIMAVQMKFNRAQLGRPHLRKAMNMLVDEKGVCQMKLIFDAQAKDVERVIHDALIAAALED